MVVSFVRPIPACAGQTPFRSFPRSDAPADPRVRGADSGHHGTGVDSRGRSPRARGRPVLEAWEAQKRRPIPACAGQTSSTPPADSKVSADPRVRGADRGRGPVDVGDDGRSPRARGRRSSFTGGRPSIGPIPACAGQTRQGGRAGHCRRADPRVRGADPKLSSKLSCSEGRSPRARGRQAEHSHYDALRGPIPACAGQTPVKTLHSPRPGADPRVRGADTENRSPWKAH